MKYALITGASKGIGKAIAEELAIRKHPLLLIARNEQLLNETAAVFSNTYQVPVHYLSVDLSEKEAANTIFNWCQSNNYGVDILVNNAGYGLSGLFEKYTAQQQADMMAVNMTAPVELTALFLPLLKQQSKAYILNIASSAAYQAVPYLSVYAATKSFLLSFSRGLQYELKKSTVSVTCVSPGATDTDFPNRAQVGAKARKAGEKLNMQPGEVAEIAINKMFAQKREVIPGMVNKLSAFMAWFLPKALVEKAAASIYE